MKLTIMNFNQSSRYGNLKFRNYAQEHHSEFLQILTEYHMHVDLLEYHHKCQRGIIIFKIFQCFREIHPIQRRVAV